MVYTFNGSCKLYYLPFDVCCLFPPLIVYVINGTLTYALRNRDRRTLRSVRPRSITTWRRIHSGCAARDFCNPITVFTFVCSRSFFFLPISDVFKRAHFNSPVCASKMVFARNSYSWRICAITFCVAFFFCTETSSSSASIYQLPKDSIAST